MKVKDLIQELNKHALNKEVMIFCTAEDFHVGVSRIEIQTNTDDEENETEVVAIMEED